MNEATKVSINLSVELAPGHKIGLLLTTPILLGCGAAGYGDAPDVVDASALGAVITLPLASRAGGALPRLAPVPGGVVMDGGGPAAVRAVLRHWAERWRRANPPVIAHVAGDSPADLAACAEALEEVREVAALEWRADSLPPDDAASIAARLRAASDKPLLVQIPLAGAPAYAEALVGVADALVVGAPPRGTAWSEEGGWVRGDVHGAGVFPMVLDALHALRECPLPLVAFGGILLPEQAVQALLAGACAVMLDIAICRAPELPSEALEAIIREMENRALDDVRQLVGREAR
ncbi:MAG: hypothetical protein QHH80_08535 [Anaerolineae bacterium]|nr:hypothetical protein [Anaerolineae bacterium]